MSRALLLLVALLAAVLAPPRFAFDSGRAELSAAHVDPPRGVTLTEDEDRIVEELDAGEGGLLGDADEAPQRGLLALAPVVPPPSEATPPRLTAGWTDDHDRRREIRRQSPKMYLGRAEPAPRSG